MSNIQRFKNRAYRYRVDSQTTPSKIQSALLNVKTPLDLAERMLNGLPGSPTETQLWIECLDAALDLQRTRGATHRFDYPTLSKNGKDIVGFCDSLSLVWDSIYTKISNLEHTGASVDRAEQYSAIFTAAQAKQIFDYVQAQNIFNKNLSLGAYGNLEALSYATFAMLGMDALTLEPVGGAQKIPAFDSAGYLSVVMHLDEPDAWQQFEKNYPTWSQQQLAFLNCFRNQTQLIGDVLYVTPFRMPLYQGKLYDFTSPEEAAYLGALEAIFNP